MGDKAVCLFFLKSKKENYKVKMENMCSFEKTLHEFMIENTSDIYEDTEIDWEVNHENFLIGSYILLGNKKKIAFYPSQYIYRDKDGDIYFNSKISKALGKMIVHIKFFKCIFDEISQSIEKED